MEDYMYDFTFFNCSSIDGGWHESSWSRAFLGMCSLTFVGAAKWAVVEMVAAEVVEEEGSKSMEEEEAESGFVCLYVFIFLALKKERRHMSNILG